ncbi:hypothetical protein HIM_00158 [Hirsutella minnesotensis 3608]|nr:hypothetical protein HIM_00158 [Hirsutella minnesotensis 3608]
MSSRLFTDLILDLGGVLFTFAHDGSTQIPPRTVKHILESPHWHRYESGKVSKQLCYENISAEFGLTPELWDDTMRELAATLRPSHDFANVVRGIKKTYPYLRIHAFSNISSSDFETLRPMMADWDFFDSVTTSASLGCRKPELDSYQRLLEQLRIDPRSSIFVDDTSDNVRNAQILGFKGIMYDNPLTAQIQLLNCLGDPVARGMQFLQRNAKNLFCETPDGTIVKDNYSQLLILQCIGDREMVVLENDDDPLWQYFIGNPVFTEEAFPKDFETTSLAHVVLDSSASQKQLAMEKILSHRTVDELPLCYPDSMRPRFCPHVAANVLRFFYLNGQGHRLDATLRYLCHLLSTKAYEFPTRYYFQADWLFYHLADLCAKCSDESLNNLRALLTAALQQRTGCDKDVVGAAMRVLAAQSLKMKNSRDLETLHDTQQADGSWGPVLLWRYGRSTRVRIRSRGFPTALAITAIKNAAKE